MNLFSEITELRELHHDLSRFTAELETLAQRVGLSLAELTADHIALRCHQNSTAERWKAGLLQAGTLFSEKIINGRPIALFSLRTPVSVGPLAFSVVELPWPGDKLYRHEGWEHIEIVLPGAPETLAARALALLSDQGLAEPGISVKHRSPRGEGETLPNPTLAVTDGKVTIKFHPWLLSEIVSREN
ncbi:MAG: Protein YecM [Candidatus Erwinia impunctatus]|nr:Protein YecM [Culicoides impunctatus]